MMQGPAENPDNMLNLLISALNSLDLMQADIAAAHVDRAIDALCDRFDLNRVSAEIEQFQSTPGTSVR
jgi:hypothetical protein